MKTMGKIIGAVLIILGIGAVGNQIAHKQIKPAQQQQTAQTQTTTQTNGKNNSEIKVTNASYGTNTRNTLNVVIPKGATSTTPFVLFIHGGAWIMGDKNDIAVVQGTMASKGIASATMNYRYASSSVHYPQLMNDVNSAVNYIVEHGKDWNVDTSKIAIAGISAGAHMSMLYAYAYDTGNHIDAVISMAGPSDITDTEFLDMAARAKLLNGAEVMVGAKYTTGKPLDPKFADSSPIKHLKNVPTLLIHGTKDTIVPYDQSVRLSTALKAAGIPHLLMPIAGANHDLGLGNTITAGKELDQIVSWVRKYEK